MGLIDLIKKTAIAAVESRNPVNVLFGTVTSVEPLEITIHQKLKLTKEFLVLPERVRIQPGDKVSILRVQGGHQFIVMDKVEDE